MNLAQFRGELRKVTANWRNIGGLVSRKKWTRSTPDERRIAFSGLFDEPWYVANNPDAARFPGGALRHYLHEGACALRDPNQYFDAARYCAQRPEARKNPLLHYLERGAAEGLRPSPAFDPAWYLKTYPDVAAENIEPLAHFLRLGQVEGRLPSEPNDFRPVTAAKLLCLKPPPSREMMALFVTHAPGAQIKPHVPPYLAALAREDIATTLIVAADCPEAVAAEHVADHVDGLYVRQNEGYDFAAWAHVVRHLDFSRTRGLYLVNDSVIGPLNPERFAALFARIRASNAHLISLTESTQITRHFQSYFLVAKAEGVAVLLDYLASVRAYENKHAVTVAYELPLLQHFLGAGLRGEALFPLSTSGNPSIEEWRELIERGMPFVKVSALRSAGDTWRGVLRTEGYDPHIAEGTLAIAEQSTAGRKK